jgi:acyl carrier protein
MASDMVVNKLKEILVEEFELDESAITPDAHLREDLDLDSLDAVDLIVALEKAFGIRVDEKVIVEMRTVGDFLEYIQEQHGDIAPVAATGT